MLGSQHKFDVDVSAYVAVACGHVCRVVYLWCTVCCCQCHLWRTLPYSAAPTVEQMPVTPATAQAATGCMDEDIVNMIKTLNGAIAAISRDRGRMNNYVLRMSPETKPWLTSPK